MQARPAASIAYASQRVRRFAGIGDKYILKAGKARERQLSFLRRAGRCKFKAVDDRLVRHKGADDIIPRNPSSKQSDGVSSTARPRIDFPLQEGPSGAALLAPPDSCAPPR